MLTDRDKLTGWLCIMRCQDPGVFFMPDHVTDALVELGWMERDEDDENAYQITDDGVTATDLAAYEWGIDPMTVEAD